MRKKVVKRGRPAGSKKKDEQEGKAGDGIGDELIAKVMYNDYEVLRLAGVEDKHIDAVRNLANNISAVGFALDGLKTRRRELGKLVKGFKENIPVDVGGDIVYFNINDESVKIKAVKGKHEAAKAGLRYSLEMLVGEFDGDSTIQKLESIIHLQLEESND